jgi:dienelactone hydrolase
MSRPTFRRLHVYLAVIGVLAIAEPAAAQLSANMQDILRRIHTTQEFGGGGRGAGAGGRWVEGGAGYTATERTADGGTEVVRYDSATGRRDVLMTTAQLTPPALGKPLQFSDYAISTDGRRMLFATNGRPTMIRKTAYEYWVLDKASGEWRKLGSTLEGGLLYAKLSPDCRWAFHGESRFDLPGQSDLVRLPDHAVVRVFQANTELKAKVGPMLAGRAEMLQVDIGGGVVIDGWLIKPRAFDPSKKYPIIVNVYGEPAGTTVTDSWGGSGRVLAAALADEGYLVASFDNRGTPAPKGRAWRKVIYGAVGVLASQEQAAALRALAASRTYVDLSRVAVYGWSGGGSMTLNLMFRSPELYKVGVAGAPVPDQALYDSIYQERYMGLPQQNAEGYRTGSPITYADGLQGKLLIIHGTGDDNVHFQGTQRLLNRLIELNKQFSFMEYPNRRHGIGGLHIDTLRWEFITQHLPAGPR